MPTPSDGLLRHIRRLVTDAGPVPATDAALLERFIACGDEEAFAALVRRHAGMVLGVCRRLLGNAADAEDAFQATFLVLARRAASVRSRNALAAYLHGVAHRLALQARAARARRLLHEASVPAPDRPGSERDPLDELSARELLAVLDEELQRLPEVYRLPILLCCLEGRSQEEAARLLGWTRGSVQGRLERGRARLEARLVRRGIALPAALAAPLLVPPPAPAVPVALLVTATRLARTPGAAAPAVAALVDGAVTGLATTKLKVGLVLALVLGMVAAGAGAVAHQVRGAKQPQAKQASETNPPAKRLTPAKPDSEKQQTRTDRYGDPLPPRALARMGTLRLFDGNQFSGLAFVPGGQVLASSTLGGGIRLWDAATGKELRTLQGRGKAVGTLAISPDGKLLASVAYEEQIIRLWDVRTGKEVRQLNGQGGGTRALAFSPDGMTLAAAAPDSVIRLWDTARGQEICRLAGHRGWISSVAFLPGGTILVSGGEDGTVRLWDVRAGRELRLVTDKLRSLWEIALSPDGRTLASAERHGTLRLWDINTGKEIRRFTAGQDAFWCMAFSPDGRHLASGGMDQRLRIWDVPTGRELRGHTGANFVQRVAYAPGGKVVATGGGGMIRLWEAATLKPALELPGHPNMVVTVRFTPHGKRLFTGCWGGVIGTWDATTGTELSPLRPPPDGLSPLPRLVIPPALTEDGERAAMVAVSGVIHAWEPNTRRELSVFCGPQGPAADVVFSPDGTTLAAVHRGGVIRLWEVCTGKGLLRIDGPPPGYRRPSFSPDGKVLATTQIVGPVVLWDAATGKELRRLPWPEGAGAARALFSPDGKTLAAWGRCPTPGADVLQRELDRRQIIRVWDLATGKDLGEFEDSAAYWIASAAFSPDSRTLALGVYGEVHLWEVFGRLERSRFQGHRGEVMALAFSPDGRLLASGSSDRTALTWDVTGLAPDGRLQAAVLRPEELEGLWADLKGKDGTRAHRAVWQFVAGAAQSLPFLKQHLRRVARVDPRQVARLLADLDSDQFEAREKASVRLTELGELAEQALLKTLEGSRPLELRRRVETILRGMRHSRTPEQLRGMRAVEVLEHIGTPDARSILESLARGAPEALLTREAKASLQRLAKRIAAKP